MPGDWWFQYSPTWFFHSDLLLIARCIPGIKVNFYSFDELQGAEMYLGIGGEGLLFGPWRNRISLENRFANGSLNGFCWESTRSWMSSGKFVGSANFFSTTSTVLPAFTYILYFYPSPWPFGFITAYQPGFFITSVETFRGFEVPKMHRISSFCNAQGSADSLKRFLRGKSFERKSSAVPTGRRCAKIESSFISSCCNWHHVGANRLAYDICQDWFWRLLDLPFKRTPNTFDLHLGRSHCLIQKLPRDTPEGS